ncbi:30S ribosomal protein S16 [Candidatus Saccharibacteria bacterium]|nr:30S ribosomal protein S16 [Candidatus Saccharibacteria bacterium]
MLAIRMQRNGRSHYPTYRIVVQEAQRHPLSGRVVAEVGNYNPETKALTLDKEAVEKYLKNGAQPSSRVAFILKKNGVKLPKWYKEPAARKAVAKHADKLRKNQLKEEVAPAEASAAEAPAEETAATEE